MYLEQNTSEKPLKGRIAVVAGATRGAGRGIAVMLGEAGATVYVTGRSTRSVRSDMDRPETIEDTAEQVTDAGGLGIPVKVDHTAEDEVRALFDRIRREQNGRLDLLVNDVWGGDPLTQWGAKFWEHSLGDGLTMQRRAVQSHMITSYYGAPLMAAMAQDLRPHGVTAIALTPGFLRSEAMLDHFGVTESNWRDGARADPHFIASETPTYIGRAVAALAADPNVAVKTGQALSTWQLYREYGFTDADGSQPDWGAYFEQHVLGATPEDRA